MSQGYCCRCPERQKPIADRAWRVLQRYFNASAFNGYRITRSDYSSVVCQSCGHVWRTKSDFVVHLKDAAPDWAQTGKP